MGYKKRIGVTLLKFLVARLLLLVPRSAWERRTVLKPVLHSGGRGASDLHLKSKTGLQPVSDAERPICIPTQSVGTRKPVLHSGGRGASGLHSHAERGNEKTRSTFRRTRSVRSAFPRRAWEREEIPCLFILCALCVFAREFF